MAQARPKNSIVARFDRLGARDGTRTLWIGPDRHATVADVDALAALAGAALAAAGLGEPRALGLIAANGPGFLSGLLACWRAGHAAVLLDPRAPAHELARAAAACGASESLRVMTAWPSTAADFVIERHPGRSRPSATIEPAAVIKLTSGSTGSPRGVAVTAEALLADDAALRATMGIVTTDRLLATLPFSHSYGLSTLVIPALVDGVSLVAAAATDPFLPLRAAERATATVLPTVPSWIAALLRLAEPPALPSAVRLVITAGAPLIPDTAVQFRERFGLPVHVFYGASECGGITYDRSGEAGERGTVGEPVDGVRVALAPIDGLDVACGRVVVESPSVALSYVPDVDARLSSGRFVSHDLATSDGAELRLLGRLDDLINVRGRKVNPTEIERVIAELDAVDDVVVHAIDGPLPGDRSVRAVVACAGGQLSGQRVAEWCRGRLSDYKVPRSVLVVRVIPRDSRGKIDRLALAGLVRATPPSHA